MSLCTFTQSLCVPFLFLGLQEREEVDEIDLRKVTDLKGPDPSGTYEQQCSIQIVVSDRLVKLPV